MQFSDIVASLKLAAQNARNNVNARRAGSINKQFAGVPVPDRTSNVQFIHGATLVDGGQFNPAAIDLRDNFLVSGGLGSGKLTAVQALAQSIADTGDSFVAWDPFGEHAAMRYRGAAKDGILNPVDARGVAYNLFSDFASEADSVDFAAAWLPVGSHPHSNAEQHRERARAVVEAAARLTWSTGERCNEAFYAYLFETPLQRLVELLEGTPAERILSSAEGQPVLATVRETLRALRYLKSGDFSLKAALTSPDTRLFLTSTADKHASLASLHCFFVGRILQLALQLSAEDALRTRFIILDDFRLLYGNPTGLLEVIRKKPRTLAIVMSLTSTQQLTQIMGKPAAESLQAAMPNQLICRTAAPREDGSCMAEGYLQLAEGTPQRVTVPLHTQPTPTGEHFVPREDLFLSVK